jgi:sodium/bile acid cotransporter 7
MSIEEDNRDLFTIIWLGNESDKSKPEMKFTNEFTNSDKLKEYIINKTNSSIIVILSDNISLDTLSPIDLPQICAVYNEKLIFLYCLPTMISSVDTYIKKVQEEELGKTSKQSCSSYVLSLIRKHWFIIGLPLAMFLAYLFPDIGKTGGYIRSEWSVKWGCVILIFFLSGLSIRARQLAKEFLHIRLHAVVQIYSLLIIPFTLYGLGLLLARLSINKTLVIGIIIMGSTSTTISSNVIMTKNAMGNEYAALVNVVIGNILGIFLSPALIFYFIKNPIFNSLLNTNNAKEQLEYKSVVKNLSLTVLIPLFIGQIIHLLWTKQVIYIREKFYFNELNSLALLILAWSMFCTAFATGSFKKIQKKEFFILIIFNGGIYITFSLLILITARLPFQYWQFPKKDSIAIMFCGAAKSLAMGISLINAFYGNQNQEITGLISLPFIIYHVEQLTFGAIAVILLKNWIQKELKTQTSTKSDNVNIRSKNEEDLQIGEAETMHAKC